MDERALRERLLQLERQVNQADATNHALLAEVAELRAQLAPNPSPAVPPAKPRGSGRAVVVVTGLALLMGLIGVGGFLLMRHAFGEQFSGQVAVSNSVFGTFDFQVMDCDSGASYVPQFFGADVKAEGRQLRIYNSGDDAMLVLWRPGSKETIEIGRNACSRWDALVEWAHVRVNQVSTVSGHLHASCALPGGGSLVADTDFARCAF